MKIINKIFCGLIIVLLISGCGKKSITFPDTGQSIIANDDYIAFFDVDDNVVVIDFENGKKTLSSSIPIVAMYEADNIMVLKLETGKYILHNPQESIVAVDGCWNENWSPRYISLFNLISENDLVSLCIVSPSCAYGLSSSGSIVGNYNFSFDEIPAKIIGNSFAEYSLDKQGHIHVLDEAYQSDFWISKIESWENIVDIECGFIPFALTKEGKIFTTITNSYYNSSDVTSWENIKKISVKPTATAALTNDGKVKICSQQEEYYEAEKWDDVIDIQMSDGFLLGITSKGELLLTSFGHTRFQINDAIYIKL